MVKKITLKELQRIREEVGGANAVRGDVQPTKVIVHMGTCGIASGAREVMSALLDEINKLQPGAVSVSQTGCLGLCDREPLVTVERQGEELVRYAYMDPERMRRVVREHVMGGRVVGEWTLGRDNR